MVLVRLHLLKQRINTLRLRNKRRRPYVSLQVLKGNLPEFFIKIAGHRFPQVQNPYDLVNIACTHRKSGKILFQHKLQPLLQLFLAVDGYNMLPVGHDVLCVLIHVTDDIVNQPRRFLLGPLIQFILAP